MSLLNYTPKSPLSTYVESIWRMSSDGLPSSRHRICPNGTMGLVIHLANRNLVYFDAAGRQSVRVPLLAGPYSTSFLIDPSEYTAVLGVRFRPGAARVFFPVQAHELHNIDVPLKDLYPREAALLYEQVLAAGSPSAQFHVLESYLLSKLPAKVPPQPAVAHAVREFLRQPGARAIADVQSEIGLSHTRFIQVFRESVGLTPKLFCRIQRFRTAVQQIENGLSVSWADLAAACGYFDQAHLIHDFRKFSGITPGAFAEQRVEFSTIHTRNHSA